MNICKPDCGWDPDQRMKYTDEVTSQDLQAPGGFDLKGHTNMDVSLAAESGDVSISDFVNMVNGKVYTIVASNGASTQNEIDFPASTLYNGTITKANGMTVVYKFWTDGKNIFCDQKIYS